MSSTTDGNGSRFTVDGSRSLLKTVNCEPWTVNALLGKLLLKEECAADDPTVRRKAPGAMPGDGQLDGDPAPLGLAEQAPDERVRGAIRQPLSPVRQGRLGAMISTFTLPLEQLVLPGARRFLRDQDDLPAVGLLERFDYLAVLRLDPADQIGVGPYPDAGGSVCGTAATPPLEGPGGRWRGWTRI